jgi:membrane protease subunit HflC
MGRVGIILLLIVSLFVGLDSVYVIQEGQLAIITQFGEYKYSISKPGIYPKLPFANQVHRMERRIMGGDTPPAEFLTKDKKRLVTDPITRWKITEPLIFYKTVRDELGAKARLGDIINSELRDVLAGQDFSQIIGNAREPLMQEVAKKTRRQARRFGIEIVDVRIKRADLPQEVQESVFKRMQAERSRIAKRYRAQGEEEAQKIRADTDKEKAILLAKAYELAQKARGEGDAQSIKVYADAYGKDPEFYAFTKSLETYEAAMDKEATVILSTSSDLFKYLNDPGR